MADGSLVVADGGSYRLRRIAPDGAIRTIARAGSPFLPPFTPPLDGEPATGAKFGLMFGAPGPGARRSHRLGS